ncbi:hypothetical protein SAMN05428954_0710 [Streptomyces sp. 2112.3]|uniref:hypothetical protein n=1 Tax=Streptomyces sp. 2112.3 TaxID=1881023 RepID=UPI00089780D0|nr:hypothetical protein [Streptomyces sp. 2112.3]SED65891.1 hypothetical protein SAMN05428954_0710 [Streptomyces sp. 2112.3]
MRGGSHQQQTRGKVPPNSRERKPCRITEAHLPAPADLAPTGTDFDDEVLAELAELEKRSAQHEIDLRPQNTVEGYAADRKQWETFCALLGLPTTAIIPGSLTAFVEWLWVQPGWKAGTFTAPSAIDRRLSGVVVTGRTEYKLTLDRTVAARAGRVLKAKVHALQKTDEARARGPAPALPADRLARDG